MRPIRCGLLALAVCVLAFASPVLAKKQQQPQNIDFGAVTCKDFVAEIAAGDEESAGIILMWIDGYLSGVSGDTVLKWGDLEKFSTDLVAYCGKKPDEKVLDAAEAVGISE